MSVAALVAMSGLVALVDPEPPPFRHTLFVQFDGAELSWVPTPEEENAALDTSFLALFEGTVVPPYDGGETDRLAVVQAVRSQLAGIGVRVVDERPPDHLPYTMAVVGGSWEDTAATSPTRGIAAEVDCTRDNQRHVVFAFVGSDEPSVQQATTISQEAAHAWGLDHVLGDGLIMSYDYDHPDPQFADGCTPLCEEACQGPDTIFCEAEHAALCPLGEQDSRAELLATFGDDTPDTLPPTVAFVVPADGAWLPPGEPLTIEAEVADDYGGFGWRFALQYEGEVVVDEVAFDRQTTWPLSELPEGHYVATLEAIDHAEHTTIVTIEFDVGQAPGSTGSLDDGTSSADASDDDSGDDGDGDASTSDDTGDPGASDDPPPDGCTCTSAPRRTPWLWLLLLAALRRSRSSPRGRSITAPSRAASRRPS